MTEQEANRLFVRLSRIVTVAVGADKAGKFLDMLAHNLYLLGDDDEA